MLTTRFVPGAPIWADLSAPDIEEAAAFYQAVLGWEFRSFGPDSGGYGLFTLGGRTAAALGPLAEDSGPPAWTLYFYSQDASATAEAAAKAGGDVRSGPFDVGTQGRMAQLTDPDGAQFAIWQPGQTRGLEIVTDPGSLAWTELHTTDPAAATSFYAEVFGWSLQNIPMGEHTYTVIAPKGGDERSTQGGVISLSAGLGAAGFGPVWLAYFEVADCDTAVKAAEQHGGSVRVPAMDVPQVGRMATVTDAAGAAFCVITSVTS